MNNKENNAGELVSIIIRTWNRERDIKETINILKAEPYKPLEIIIVDNGSSDNTVNMLRNNFPELELITLSENTGVAATNIGIKKARGTYFLLLDDDAYPQAGSISLAVNKFKESPNLSIAAFKTIDQATGFCPESKFEKGKREEERKEGIKVKRFRGCGVMIKRKVIEKVGGYPEDFFMWGEESDLAFRAINAGYEIRYYPELIIHHRLSPRCKSLSKKTYYETRNLIWLYWKYSPIVIAFLKTIYFVIFMGIKSLERGTVIYYFRGLLDGIKRLPAVMKQRQVVYSQTIRYAITHNLLKKVYRKK